MKILITGVAGTGKSTIVKALDQRGISSIDLHDVPGLFFWQDKETKEKVEYAPVQSREWFDKVDRFCDVSRLKGILDQHNDIVMAGTISGNQEEYYALFDKLILLQCSPQTLIHRMETRINKSGYGKTKAEQEDNIAWQKEFEPLLLSRGAIPVNTEGNLDEVVDEIIKIIKFRLDEEDNPSWTKTLNKDRASGIVIKDDKVLLIHRIRDDKEYWVFPGGSIEGNETIEEALGRELSEELSITVKDKKFLFKIENAGRFEHYFLITEYEGTPKMGGPELERMNEKNQYILEQRDVKKLSEINLLPKGIADKITKL